MITPYEYYRQRRPELFSDTKVINKITLTKEVFQYQLERLSNDMKQDQFEKLTRSLMLRFVTPNILPQTGPTGGGDGKTDLETHPVADEIAEKWYVCDGGCKGSEKWAVAISCREDWEAKLKEDVKKIIETQRGFTQILFFSNRLIKSRDSKACEDKLFEKYNVPVRIFSQDWFVDKVIQQDCLGIAVKELGISNEYVNVEIEEGPNDKSRKQRIAELENAISDRRQNTILDTELVDMALESAELSRNVEEAPSIVRGKLERAEKLASKYGSKQQLFNAIYMCGWTEFFWLQNPDATYQCFQKMKQMMKDEINVNRIEKLVNLFFILESATNQRLFKEEIELNAEKEYFETLHRNLQCDKNHRSSYLYLHISWLEMKMMSNSDDKDLINDVLDDLSKTFKEANHHIDISLEINEEVLGFLGNQIQNNEKFESLIDELTILLSDRKKDIVAGEIQMRRGFQNLEAEKFDQAIRHLGQCISLFGKEQSKANYVRSCGYLGMAFLGQDLLYAAKVMFVKTISMLLHQIVTEGSSDHLLITVFSQICEMELRAGQIVDFFNFYRLRSGFSNINPDFQDDRLLNQSLMEENLLAVRLMSADCSDKIYGYLPAILDRFGMSIPLDTLYYKLGYYEKVSKEFSELIESERDFLNKLRREIKNDYFLYANSIAQEYSTMETLVSGCRITVKFKTCEILHTCAELLLAYIESFCSTMSFKDFVFATNHIQFDLNLISEGSTDIVRSMNSNEYVFNVNSETLNSNEYWNTMASLIGLLLTQNAVIKDDPHCLFDDKQTKEKLFNRLSSMMDYFSEIKNVEDDQYKYSIYDLTKEDDIYFEFKGKDDLSTPFESSRGKQSELTISSIIDFPLWEKAKWSGCGFYFDTLEKDVPILLFCYQDINYGRKIFEGWMELQKKQELNLRVSFVLHIDKNHPAWYRVHICHDIEAYKNSLTEIGRHVVQTSKYRTMNANTSDNLDRFRRLFSMKGECGISAVYLNSDKQMDFNQKFKYILPLNNVIFREAWEIGINDIDSLLIEPDDNPIIPNEHKKDAPIIELLERKKHECSD